MAMQMCGKTEKAREHFRKAVALAGRDARAHLGLGAIELDSGHPDEAIRHFDEALCLDPKSVDALLHRAEARQVTPTVAVTAATSTSCQGPISISAGENTNMKGTM